MWDKWKILYEQNKKITSIESLRIDALQTGFLSESVQKVNGNIKIDAAAIEADLSGRFQIEQKRTGDELSLWLWPSILFFDGREANRDWLQETPDPVSSIVWDSWAEVSSQTAIKLKVDERDQIEIHSQAGSIPITVHVTETIQNGSIAVMVGQGHTSPFLQTAFEKGANGFNLLTPNLKKKLFVTISKTGKSELLVTSIQTSDQQDRDILKTVSLDNLQSNLFKIENITWPLPKGYTKLHRRF
jgi:molybdopterin-containing oxidoreductase family iron-sulfur binding subunit